MKTQIQIGSKKVVVDGSPKAAFYSMALERMTEQNPTAANRPLVRAMLGILGDKQAQQNGGADVAQYFADDQRFVNPPTIAAQMEGTVLNALATLDEETNRSHLTDEQRGIFGRIKGDEIAEFVNAARQTTVRCDDGRVYDVGTYLSDLAEVGSKDTTGVLSAAFGMEEPTAKRLATAIKAAWNEGGVKGKQAQATRRDLGIQIPPQAFLATDPARVEQPRA